MSACPIYAFTSVSHVRQRERLHGERAERVTEVVEPEPRQARLVECVVEAIAQPPVVQVPTDLVDEHEIVGRSERVAAAGNEALKGVGTPIDPELVAQAIREHGNLGLRALDVAAEWSLASKNPPVAPQRKTPEGARPRSSRRCITSGSSRDGPRRDPDDEPPLVPLPRRVPADRLVPLTLEQLQRGRTMRDLARRAGVPERRFRSILAGDQTNVSFGVADALVTHALGGPTLWLWELADLYGAAV